MTKRYVTPFDWDFVDDKTLIYNSATTEEEIREMIGQALDEALDDAVSETVDGAVSEAISNMDIKLEGEDLLYKLIVNGSENGEINIPKDQFLKSTSYDSENKKLVFVMQTADGDVTTEVSISDLVASIEEKNQEQDTALAEKADKSELENFATREEVEAIEIPDVSGFATKEEVEAVDAKVDALEIPSIDGLATVAQVEAVDAKVDAIEIPDVSGFATKEEVEAVDIKVDAIEIPDVSGFATKEEVEAVDAKVDAIEIPDVSGFAVAAAVTEEIAAAVAPKANAEDVYTKVDADEKFITEHQNITGKVDRQINGTNGKALIFNEADGGGAKFEHNDGTWSFAGVNDGGENGIAGQIYALKKNAEDKFEGARIDITKDGMYYTVGAESAANRLVDGNKIAVKSDIAAAVAEVVANADSDFDTLKEVADYIASDKTNAAEIVSTLSGHGEAIENLGTAVEAVDAKVDALVIPSVEGLAVAEEVTAEIAAAVAPLAVAADVYTKEAADELFLTEHQSLDGYVPVEDYNDLKARLDALEIMLSVYNAEREAQMDEIIANMSADNKEVVIDTLMESIVVPETTTAYKITAPLTDNSTVELTSNKYAYIINTSEKPVSTTVSHEYNNETSATTVYLSGQFDTLTLENITIGSSSSIEPATVNAVVIPETNHQNITLALVFNDGATITNDSEYAVTINNKGEGEGAMTIVAPNSTVTLNNGSYTTLNAEVSDNTLVVKKIAHIKNLNVTKGNVKVEVGRASAVSSVVENYTVAEGYSLDYIHDDITSANVSKLSTEGTWTLTEDINKSGRFAPGIFASDDIVWNLNGHNMTFTNTAGYANFLLRGSLQLEINGNGTITNNAGDYGFWAAAEGVKVVVNGGTFYAATHVLYAEKGTIEVNGGEFHLTDGDTADRDANGNFKFLLNCKDENYTSGIANIIVKGGKFYDFDPGNCAAEGVGTSFLADGYVSIESTEIIDGVEHKVFEVKPING